MRIYLYDLSNLTPDRLSMVVISYRLCVEVFRVLTKDAQPPLLTPVSVIEYMNQHKDFFPLSVA